MFLEKKYAYHANSGSEGEPGRMERTKVLKMREIVDDRTTTPLLAHPQNTATAVTHLHSPNVAETTHVDPPTDIRRIETSVAGVRMI